MYDLATSRRVIDQWCMEVCMTICTIRRVCIQWCVESVYDQRCVDVFDQQSLDVCMISSVYTCV